MDEIEDITERYHRLLVKQEKRYCKWCGKSLEWVEESEYHPTCMEVREKILKAKSKDL